MASPTEQDIKRQIRERFFRLLNVLSIYVYFFVVYSVGWLTEYALSVIFARVLRDTIAQYLVVSMCFDRFNIGLAFAAMVSFLIHAGFVVYSQIKLEREEV